MQYTNIFREIMWSDETSDLSLKELGSSNESMQSTDLSTTLSTRATVSVMATATATPNTTASSASHKSSDDPRLVDLSRGPVRYCPIWQFFDVDTNAKVSRCKLKTRNGEQ